MVGELWGCSEAAVALVVALDGLPVVLCAEVGPEDVEEYEFGVGGVPEQEVGEALFPCCSDQQVDIGHVGVFEVPGECGFGELWWTLGRVDQ